MSEIGGGSVVPRFPGSPEVQYQPISRAPSLLGATASARIGNADGALGRSRSARRHCRSRQVARGWSHLAVRSHLSAPRTPPRRSAGARFPAVQDQPISRAPSPLGATASARSGNADGAHRHGGPAAWLPTRCADGTSRTAWGSGAACGPISQWCVPLRGLHHGSTALIGLRLLGGRKGGRGANGRQAEAESGGQRGGEAAHRALTPPPAHLITSLDRLR